MLPKMNQWILVPRTCEVITSPANKVFGEEINLRQIHTKVCPSKMREKCSGPCKGMGKEAEMAAVPSSQGMPRITDSHQEMGESGKSHLYSLQGEPGLAEALTVVSKPLQPPLLSRLSQLRTLCCAGLGEIDALTSVAAPSSPHLPASA